MFHYNRRRIKGTLYEDHYTFLVICRSVLFGMRNVSDKFVEKIKTHILCSVIFFFENLAVYEITWKSMVDNMAYANSMLDT